MTRRDYENARKNASKENTKVSDDEGYLNQRLNMDWGWLRSFSGVGPFSLTRCLPFPWFCTDLLIGRCLSANAAMIFHLITGVLKSEYQSYLIFMQVARFSDTLTTRIRTIQNY